MRRHFCQACSFIRRGVKTRIAITHTCDGTDIPEPPELKPRETTKEELYKYLARLKELMEPGSPEYVPSDHSNNAELQAKKLSNENTSRQI